jgi:(p)ppGpp synthase/HD superfamily hydrolase
MRHVGLTGISRLVNSPAIEDAILVAVQAHRGALDKGGAPYILHALRVMLAVSPDARRVAIAHDLIEDASVTFEQLRAVGYSARELAALETLTRRGGEPYDTYIARVKADALAREVKVADLADNLDVRRLRNVDTEACARLERYRAAWLALRRAEEAVASPGPV